jgi:hypothetical protein
MKTLVSNLAISKLLGGLPPSQICGRKKFNQSFQGSTVKVYTESTTQYMQDWVVDSEESGPAQLLQNVH